MLLLLTVLVGCKTDDKKETLSEQIMGSWSVTEMFDDGKWIPASQADMVGVFIQFRPGNTVSFYNGYTHMSGTYILEDKKVTCTMGDEKMYVDIVSLSGNSGEVTVYYSLDTTAEDKMQLRIKK